MRRREALAGFAATGAAMGLPGTALATQAPILEITGNLAQGGMIIGRTAPGATVTLGDATTVANAQGRFVAGFDRDAAAAARIVASINGQSTARDLTVRPRQWVIQRVNGVPPRTVNPPESDAQQIAREVKQKADAFASNLPLTGFLEPFAWPVRGRISGRWGNQRVLNGEPRSPHYGVDIANPVGTPVRAPASGRVVLAERAMYFEGGLIFIDHGQGLITAYLHLSRVDVAVGQDVAKGAVIGAVGATGRATGAHLCWRMKWRGRNLDPSLAAGPMPA